MKKELPNACWPYRRRRHAVLAEADLGLVFEEHDPGYPVIDALNVRVNLLDRLAADEETVT